VNIKDLAVITDKLAALAVTAAKIATDAVETLKIKDANVTAVKLATDAVETVKIKDSAVTAAKLGTGITTFAKTILDDADAAAAMTTLGAIGASLLTTDGDMIRRESGIPVRVPERALVIATPSGLGPMAYGVWATMPLGTESVDRGSNYNTGTKTFTVPRTGYYLIIIQMKLYSIADGKVVGVRAYKNGSTVISEGLVKVGSASENMARTVAIASLTQSDAVVPQGYNGDTSDKNMYVDAESSYMHIYELL
jgi:hypothetical protein